jgi:hypothetical protein
MEETLGTRRGEERWTREEEKKKRSEEAKRKQQIRVHKSGCPGEGAMVVPAYLGVPRPDIGFGYIRLPLSILSLFGCLQIPPSRAYCMKTSIWYSASSFMPVSMQRKP